jgi:putative hydrolases of HD superfamily
MIMPDRATPNTTEALALPDRYHEVLHELRELSAEEQCECGHPVHLGHCPGCDCDDLVEAEGVTIDDDSTSELTDAVIYMAELALRFGKIARTACYHPDKTTRETDTTHTVMLGWIACALASRHYPELDPGLVAQFALVHDAPEVHAGDTQTLRISPEERAAKKVRERAAGEQLWEEFGELLPWLPACVGVYEAQKLPEARFVRALDKSLPKIVHLLDGMTGLREFGFTHDELSALLSTQLADVASYAGEFAELLDIRQELSTRLLAHPRWASNGYVAPEPVI